MRDGSMLASLHSTILIPDDPFRKDTEMEAQDSITSPTIERLAVIKAGKKID